MAIDIKAIEGSLGAAFPNLGKDVLRTGMFGAAIVKKAVELATTGIGQEVAFAEETASILAQYAREIAHINFWSLLSHPDLFKNEREAVRAFAKKWQLDPEFIALMG